MNQRGQLLGVMLLIAVMGVMLTIVIAVQFAMPIQYKMQNASYEVTTAMGNEYNETTNSSRAAYTSTDLNGSLIVIGLSMPLILLVIVYVNDYIQKHGATPGAIAWAKVKHWRGRL